ncbi:fibronectin type III domain-containing protein [Peredibacter starrii]|uniref:Fibronectin type-III domain-containing protein n=1 Tax=Peredibacter starrii TaxID=28202 RepID=A0AAX4HKV8_9BACT|nr:fibronectin type III domain-containing protein [Peredibacter starrii]WPU63800.1 hypothetical protein SOO65_13985 [Peredibacter starrii]
MNADTSAMSLVIWPIYVLLFMLLAGCNEINIAIKDSFISTPGPLVTINKAVSESVGSCSFTAAPAFTQNANFEYRVTFSEVIDPLTLDVSDFNNSGTGSGVVWNLTNCGDDQNFKLAVTAVGVDGTVVPTLARDSALSLTNYGNKPSTTTDNVVTVDTLSPSVTLNLASNQTVGSCVFTTANGYAGASGFSYRVTFSERINSSTFTNADITNSGSGGSTLGWTITSCGDGRNFRLSAASVSGDGTIIPSINANVVEDLAGNLNTASTSTDNTINYDTVAPTVTIEQSINQTVGACTFTAASDPTNTSNLQYRVQVSEPIIASTLTPSDFVNAGTGGNITLQWSVTSCGDNQNFMLSSIAVMGDGTIVPNLPANAFTDRAGNGNSLSTSVDNSITFSISGPGVTINQAVAETIGSCTFNATTDPTDVVGFEYKITFSKPINDGTFDLSDITNSGTGGATTLNWTLTNCHENTVFMLKTTAIDGYGTIIPNIAAGSVQDLVGNSNSASTATDNVVLFAQIGWSQEAYIKALDNESYDSFGMSVSLSGDTLAVGGEYDDNNQNIITNGPTFTSNNDLENSGAVHIYKRSGVNWAQEAYIKAPNATVWKQFGKVISLDGDTLAVGMASEGSPENVITNGSSASMDDSGFNVGAVYVFRKVSNEWAQEAYIKAGNSQNNDNFGHSVALDGNTLIVGADQEDSDQVTITNGPTATTDNSMEDSGAVYVFYRSGSNWEQEAYIKAGNNSEYDYFGTTVALSNDTIAVGSPWEDSFETIITNGSDTPTNDIREDSGAVYVYRRVAGLWQQEALIKASNSTEYYQFGEVIALDKDTLVVTSLYESSNQTSITNGTGSSSDISAENSGAVYVYKRTGSNWAQEAYIKSSNSEAFDSFGFALDLQGDYLVVGVPEEDSNQNTITKGAGASADNSTENSGAVYVFKRTGTNWAQTAYIKSPINEVWYGSGYSVSLSGDTLAISAPGDSNDLNTVINGSSFAYNYASESSGAVYIYRFNGELLELGGVTSSIGLTSVTIDWAKLLTANNYIISYQAGSVAPASCSVGTIISAGDVNHYVVNGLTTGTTYSFRLCATNGSTVTSGVTFSATPSDVVKPTVTVEQSVSETVGSCVFTPVSEPVTAAGFSYKVTFSSVINPATFTAADISNAGSGGANLTWQIDNCGDDRNFKITAVTVSGQGTIIPTIGAGKVARPNGVTNLASTSTDNSISYIEYGWNQEAYIKVSNAPDIYGFGEVLSLSEDTLVVGVSRDETDQNTITTSGPTPGASGSSGSGAVHVYKRNGSVWELQAFIKAVNNADYILFGESVSLHGDLLAVGATGEGSNQTTITNGNTASTDESTYSTGAVYVYKRTGTTWEQEAYIKAANADNFDNFGSQVSLHGSILAVSATGESSNETTITNGTTASPNNTLSESGAVYLYERTTGWDMTAFIKASNAGASDKFGERLSIHGDTLAVGTPNEGSNETTITNGTGSSLDNTNGYSGAVYVYRKSGKNWEQEAYIKASNNDAGDGFGSAISLEGDYLAVGAPWEASSDTSITNGSTSSSDNSNPNAGAVYVYKRTGTTWAQEAYIKPVNSLASQSFGSSVAFNGRFLAVGAPGEDSNQRIITNGGSASSDTSLTNSGAVYVYERLGTDWEQSAYIKASNNDGLMLAGGDFPGDLFGASVSFKGDTLVVGASDESSCQNFITNGTTSSSDNSCMSAGGVYVYRNNIKLFDVTDLVATPDTDSITLEWVKTGSTTTSYLVAMALGSTPPADCSGAVNVGNVTSYVLSGLDPETIYSVRVCSTNGTDITEGLTLTVETNSDSTN